MVEGITVRIINRACLREGFMGLECNYEGRALNREYVICCSATLFEVTVN